MSERASIKATDNGPLIVKGQFTVLDGEGREYSIDRAVVALCRCGHSQNKPFCDGSHARMAFRNEAREPNQLDAVRDRLKAAVPADTAGSGRTWASLPDNSLA